MEIPTSTGVSTSAKPSVRWRWDKGTLHAGSMGSFSASPASSMAGQTGLVGGVEGKKGRFAPHTSAGIRKPQPRAAKKQAWDMGRSLCCFPTGDIPIDTASCKEASQGFP